MKPRLLLTVLTCLLPPAINAYAEQSGSGHYTAGSYSDFSGMPPTEPGFYIANYFLDYSHATFSGSKDLPFGRLLALGVTANVQAETPAVIYAYPFNLYGVTLSSGIAVPFVWMDIKANAIFTGRFLQRSGRVEQSASGLGDIQLMPIMAGWTNGDFKLGGMFNIWAPSGDYSTSQLANQGLGYWTIGPALGFSWLSSKIGTELSVFTGVDFNTRNHDADYQSGDIFHVDATLAQHLPLFGGFVGAGATTFYREQFTGDSGSGASLGSFKSETYGVGPTLSYVRKIGKSDLIVNGSWLPQLHSGNTTKGDYWWVKLTLAF